MDNSENVFYLPSNNNTIDVVLLNNVYTAYPLHTHADLDYFSQPAKTNPALWPRSILSPDQNPDP